MIRHFLTAALLPALFAAALYAGDGFIQACHGVCATKQAVVVQKVHSFSHQSYITGGHYPPVAQQHLYQPQKHNNELSPQQVKQIAEIVSQVIDKKAQVAAQNATDAVTYHCGKCHGAGRANQASFDSSGPWDEAKVVLAMGALSGILPDGRKLEPSMAVRAKLHEDPDEFGRVLADLPQMPRLHPPTTFSQP